MLEFGKMYDMSREKEEFYSVVKSCQKHFRTQGKGETSRFRPLKEEFYEKTILLAYDLRRTTLIIFGL